MCRKNPEDCQAKVKCKCCKSVLNNNTEFGGDLMLNFKSLNDIKLGIPVGRMFVLSAERGPNTSINFDTEIVFDSSSDIDYISNKALEHVANSLGDVK